MGDRFANFLYKDIFQEQNFKNLFSDMLSDYILMFWNKKLEKYNSKYNKLLRYADVLSFSEIEEYQNIAQQIVIILSQLFPNEKIVQIFKETIYKNVSNFASIELLKNKNLLSNTKNDFLSSLVYNTHRFQNNIISNVSFFDTQIDIFRSFERNQYYSFSAPTSMGKTFVITKFILQKLKDNIQDNFIILVPTRALISEITNNMIKEFKDYIGSGKHRVVSNLSYITDTEKFIAILTPERLYYSMLKNPNLKISYLFIDEAYKISSKDKRSIVYYKILDMLKSNNDVRIFFSSPVIPNPDVYLKLTNYFNNNTSNGHTFKFSPVIQNKIYIDICNKSVAIYNSILNNFQKSNLKINYESNIDALLNLGRTKCNLIYVSSTTKAISLARKLEDKIGKNNELKLSKEIRDELEITAKDIENKIHKEYYLASLIRSGIAYHIGALPSSIRVKIENLLRKGFIKYCFCTSTLLEGVNVPVDNLFVFDNKKAGNTNLSHVDALNLVGRAGRVSLNEFGNVFIIIENERVKKNWNKIFLNKMDDLTLLPNQAITLKTKKMIVDCLLKGKTNLIEVDEKPTDKNLTQDTYEYATKCLNMLLHDICTNNKSYIIRDFEGNGVLSPQNIIDIKNKFKNYLQEDNDINISVKQNNKLVDVIKNGQIKYPEDFDYKNCLNFLEELSKIFQWPIYEQYSLGKGNCLRYYSVLLLKWMQGKGLHEIIRETLDYYNKNKCLIENFERQKVDFNNSIEHKNIVINNIMKDLENIINYKFSMYFLRFSETYLKYYNKTLQNDWYQYVEYGTCNRLVIMLQQYGFTREEAISIQRFNEYIQLNIDTIRIKTSIFDKLSPDLKISMECVKINYPEIFEII